MVCSSLPLPPDSLPLPVPELQSLAYEHDKEEEDNNNNNNKNSSNSFEGVTQLTQLSLVSAPGARRQVASKEQQPAPYKALQKQPKGSTLQSPKWLSLLPTCQRSRQFCLAC